MGHSGLNHAKYSQQHNVSGNSVSHCHPYVGLLRLGVTNYSQSVRYELLDSLNPHDFRLALGLLEVRP